MFLLAPNLGPNSDLSFVGKWWFHIWGHGKATFLCPHTWNHLPTNERSDLGPRFGASKNIVKNISSLKRMVLPDIPHKPLRNYDGAALEDIKTQNNIIFTSRSRGLRYTFEIGAVSCPKMLFTRLCWLSRQYGSFSGEMCFRSRYTLQHYQTEIESIFQVFVGKRWGMKNCGFELLSRGSHPISPL